MLDRVFCVNLKICLFILFLCVYIRPNDSLDGLALCQQNCNSSDRLFGPTRPTNERPYPWTISPFPTRSVSFCQLGCQLLFSIYTSNDSCLNQCDYTYRYKVTTGYSELGEIALLECRDGCKIGIAVCEAGYSCSDGTMRPCPAGTYREGVANITLVNLVTTKSCTACPFGRYRALTKGKSDSDCTKCPVNTYANVTGGVSDSNCLRCPAGKFSTEEGSKFCKCITQESCGLTINDGGTEETFFSDGVDYYRETVPFIGRW